MRLRAQPPVYSPLGAAALLSGLRASLGARSARAVVENLLSETYQPHGLLLTDSGTTALALALRLAVAERPGPVALPAYCCYDIATAADTAGVPFLLYDLDPSTLGPELGSLRRAFESGARVTVAVHLYGMPVDMPAMDAMARDANAIVIEDAAQGTGGRLGGRPLGSLGRYAVLSFGRGKGMTGGRGGALLANSPDVAATLHEAASLVAPARGGARDAATLLAQWILARPSLYALPLGIPALRLGETVYRAPTPPATLSSFALGTLRRTLRLAAHEAGPRRRNAERLLARVRAGGSVAAPQSIAGAEPGYLRLPVVVDDSALARFRAPAARFAGVWPGYPKSLSDLPGFGSRRSNPSEPTPGAQTLAERLFTVPTHSLLREPDLVALAALIDPGEFR